MLETDRPATRRCAKICSKRFSARGVGVYEEWIRDVARECSTRPRSGEPFDFVSEISRELPIRFLCSIFTVPQEDAPALIEWGDQMIANQDPDLSAAVVGREDTEEYRLLPFRSPTARKVFAYADRQRDAAGGAGRRRDRGPGGRAERGLLSEREYHNYFALLLIAGNETTRQTISSGMLALAEHPDQSSSSRTSPTGSLGHEEILRWATPVMHFRSTATRDVEIRG